jgi:hypothetical protein
MASAVKDYSGYWSDYWSGYWSGYWSDYYSAYYIPLSRDLQERALTTLVRAEEAEELNVALQAIRQAIGNLELLAKLLDELDERA